KAQQWTGLPVSQQFVVTDPSGFLQPIPESNTSVSVPANSNTMTVSITGGATGGTQQTLLEWVFMLPSTSPLNLNSQCHTISQSRRNLVQDWELDPDSDNAPNKTYAMASLYDLCKAPNAECLIVEFNLPGFKATD